MAAINLIGKVFGRLEVIERDWDYVQRHNLKKKATYWKCKCDCGKQISVRADHLNNRTVQSCGCLKSDILSKNLENQVFGRLTALYKTGKKNKNGHYIWRCQCSCGNECDVASSYLLNGHTKSCGCITSKGEAAIEQLLQKNNILYEKEKWFVDFIYENGRHPKYDFYLPNYNRLIEFDGEHHYEENSFYDISLEEYQNRDSIKNQYAKSHHISLVRIPYWERDNLTLEMLLGNQYLLSS